MLVACWAASTLVACPRQGFFLGLTGWPVYLDFCVREWGMVENDYIVAFVCEWERAQAHIYLQYVFLHVYTSQHTTNFEHHFVMIL